MENRADNLPSLVHQASKPGPRSSQSCLAAKSSHDNFLIYESTKYIKLSTKIDKGLSRAIILSRAGVEKNYALGTPLDMYQVQFRSSLFLTKLLFR